MVVEGLCNYMRLDREDIQLEWELDMSCGELFGLVIYICVAL
jgi:phage shock protein PspC (stress-responsive transcriptional regulator)